MKVNARTDKFQHLEVFDKPALFTNGRIARDTVPEGWYCYDIRGSDDDPGELCYMEENVVVNHAGSVLMPEKLAMPKSGRLDVRDELGFLDEGNMTLREFCEAHQLPYPAENMKFHIRPARPEEAGLFYTPHPEEDKRLGAVGCVRMDFGRSGNEFWHTWWPRGPEELNSPAFKKELQEVVDTLRESVLKNRFAMERFCYDHGGKIDGGYVQNYMNRLDQLSRDELIQAADEISAMMTCHSELMAFGENLSRKKMIFLLQQEKPLELLSEAWMEHQTVDVGETFQSLLTGLYDETRQTQVRDMVYAIQPKTIEELLTSYPDDYFQLMTPCGFVDLTPSETEKLLHGEATMAHPGVSGCQMPVEAQELLEMEVLSLKRDEHGCWYALTDHPQQKMEQAPQEPQML